MVDRFTVFIYWRSSPRLNTVFCRRNPLLFPALSTRLASNLSIVVATSCYCECGPQSVYNYYYHSLRLFPITVRFNLASSLLYHSFCPRPAIWLLHRSRHIKLRPFEVIIYYTLSCVYLPYESSQLSNSMRDRRLLPLRDKNKFLCQQVSIIIYFIMHWKCVLFWPHSRVSSNPCHLYNIYVITRNPSFVVG